MRPKTAAFALIFVAYLTATGAALALLAGAPATAPWDALLADLAATVVVFAFSRRYRNSSFYDPYWSVIPPLLALWWFAHRADGVDLSRAAIVVALVWLWGIRLTANWARHWGGLAHEDWRYPLVRARAGRHARLADFLGIHLMPTLQVFVASLPIYAVMTRGTAPLGALDLLAAVVTLGAILIETVADLQLHAYLARKPRGGFIAHGLWAWSRHPNYLGEVSFWWGLLLFGLAAAPSAWWWLPWGALAMTAMFVFVSIPLMDRRNLERRPAYAEHMRRVPALLPRPPRRSPSA
ncbi:DUF1295 domain-containing protein [Solimonas variicoloris]|uniref:DUF1295 domain-containing protein n=1 Tax=Solimonas variicoloris TaxID=254408 RepID=UPI00036070DE|nr:DUF1295 domain-containing protein [Solimonas variicoloris]